MRKEKGVTMVSLVIYVAVMIIALGVMSNIVTNFYKNTDTMQGNLEEIVEFNKFNNYFLKEVKAINNRVDHVSNENNYILFTSGNSFSLSNNAIYYNDIKICKNVKEIEFILEKDTEDTEGEHSIVKVTLKLENFNKSIRYKLENIY